MGFHLGMPYLHTKHTGSGCRENPRFRFRSPPKSGRFPLRLRFAGLAYAQLAAIQPHAHDLTPAPFSKQVRKVQSHIRRPNGVLLHLQVFPELGAFLFHGALSLVVVPPWPTDATGFVASARACSDLSHMEHSKRNLQAGTTASRLRFWDAPALDRLLFSFFMRDLRADLRRHIGSRCSRVCRGRRQRRLSRG